MHRMSNQKRRIVYFSDEEWEDIKARAKRLDMTASAYLRSAGIPFHVKPIDIELAMAERPMTAQAQRDAILRRIAKQ